MNYYFSWIDYALLILMLLVSAAVGVYYGFIKKQQTAADYLLGGKKMGMWPIALSLISSSMSGLPLLTFPTEVYYYGIHFGLTIFLVGIVITIAYFVYIPVFYKLQVTSSYEYFKLRFNNRLRTLASIFYTIYMIMYLPLVIYVPALALSQVTGINSHIITPVICGVCIFYTTFGGLKAVVWTDVLQFVIMIGSMAVVAIIGTFSIGGFGSMFKILENRGRFEIKFDIDPTLRDTFWTGTIANFFFFASIICANQSTVQKCLSLSSFKEIRNSLAIFAVGTTAMITFILFCGMAMFGRYYDCDPVAEGKVEKRDQLLPYYVMDVSRNVPGLPGLFISGILSAALSTLSAAMNCLAATVYEDFIKPCMRRNISEKTASIILKSLVLFIGIAATSLVYVVEHLGSLFPLAMSFMSVAGGPLLGLFTVGMLIPMVNSKGALWGGLSSLIIMLWIMVGGQFHRNEHPYQTLNVSTAACLEFNNSNTLSTAIYTVDEGFFLYRISPFYYLAMAVIIVVVISVIVSYYTKDNNLVINRDCISPVVHFLLEDRQIEDAVKYYGIDRALNILTERS